MIYDIFYRLHIISAIAWLGAFVVSLIFAFYVGRSFGTIKEKQFMQNERRAAGIGAHIGAVGILGSGWVMAVIPGGPQWGWFNIPLYNWLAIKQLVFFIILILVALSIKNGIALKRRLQKENGKYVSENSRKKWKRAYGYSLAIYFLVILNTYLGWAKPI